jgi:(1->4)-alpha-D-glucan 1-alpha-D-glucosylmutase
MIPRATYRVQFRKEFGFADASNIVPYLGRLGVSDLYASPYLRARPGSTHGYDIVAHNELNPELGSVEAFGHMIEALRQNNLGQILDFVPNHMGVGGADNPAWLDVLEWGPDSIYAGWFDVDWDSERRYLRDKLLVPLLGDQYGLELERGALRLRFSDENGDFAVWAYETHKLPICPMHYGEILGYGDPLLERLGDAFTALPDWRPQVVQQATKLKSDLATLARDNSDARSAIDIAIARFSGREGGLSTWQDLD